MGFSKRVDTIMNSREQVRMWFTAQGRYHFVSEEDGLKMKAE